MYIKFELLYSPQCMNFTYKLNKMGQEGCLNIVRNQPKFSFDHRFLYHGPDLARFDCKFKPETYSDKQNNFKLVAPVLIQENVSFFS